MDHIFKQRNHHFCRLQNVPPNKIENRKQDKSGTEKIHNVNSNKVCLSQVHVKSNPKQKSFLA
jgi:hypothetical protein